MLPQTANGRSLYQPDGEVLDAYFWSRGKVDIIQGPVGSGTSTASAHRIWRLACEQAPDRDGVRRTRWIVSRTTYKELATTFIPTTWLSWFPESDWGALLRSEPANHRIMRDHPSGDGTKVDCDVWFLALPDAETAEKVLASFEITGFFYNEAQFVDKGVITELLSRCARYPSMKDGPGATWYGGFLDLNAPVEGHWIPYMRGDLPLPPEFTDEQKAEFEKPESWNFFVQPPGLIETIEKGKIVYQPNPKAENQKWLAETYIEKIRGWDKAKIDRRVLNKVGLYVEGKPVYPTFLESEHASRTPIRLIPSLPIIVGLDFGREPAAAFCQCVNGSWQMLHELIGENESATIFGPKVKRVLAQTFPGHTAEFWGDPRGDDKGQNDESTAYQIFQSFGMRVLPATTDNNPEMRRSSVNAVLGRRNGLLIDPSCLVCRTGMAGGYHYPKIKGVSGVFSDKPRKNRYSHIVEALENALMGGGEADAVITSISRPRPSPSPARRHKVTLRRYGTR